MKEKIRTPIFWFATFMALMLFQTPYRSLGTLTALFTMTMTIIMAFFSGNISLRQFYFPMVSRVLLVFLCITVLVSWAYGDLPGSVTRYVAQIVLCIALLAIPPVNEREERFLHTIFIVASVVYAVLAIRSCMILGSSRYYHGHIVLFKTRFDPNFIGIPLVAASVLTLNNLLEGNRRFLNAIAYITLVLAIVYTASRGNLLSLAFSNAIVAVFFLRRKGIPFRVRMLVISVVVILAFFMVGHFTVNYSRQWERMTAFGEGADNGRFNLWSRAFDVWKKHLFFGCGFGGMFRDYQSASHNTYFQLLSETGIIGFSLFAYFVGSLLLRMYRKRKVYFALLAGCLLQIMFLDALDNRCVWVILCWLSLIPARKERLDYENQVNHI